ncbi:unnamed protein product [Cuscuta epithymum]|uniref:Uncharacterized protein n=1 Tax=Cuscuta epithymum TaxID=186058 RepID=A0AAV0EWJ2_9ASTE|nr:unnamed protein product [Cuscuta epithymum]
MADSVAEVIPDVVQFIRGMDSLVPFCFQDGGAAMVLSLRADAVWSMGFRPMGCATSCFQDWVNWQKGPNRPRGAPILGLFWFGRGIADVGHQGASFGRSNAGRCGVGRSVTLMSLAEPKVYLGFSSQFTEESSWPLIYASHMDSRGDPKFLLWPG